MAQAAANVIFIGITLAVMVCENTMLAKMPVKNPPICAALSMPGMIYPKIIVSDAKPKAPQNNQRNSCSVIDARSLHKNTSAAP